MSGKRGNTNRFDDLPGAVLLHVAAQKLHVSHATVLLMAGRLRWPVQRLRLYGRTQVCYYPEDVKALGLMMNALPGPGLGDRKGEPDHARAIVAWADVLTEWPPVDEILEWESKDYRQHDIESVIENRVQRKKTALVRPEEVAA